jgi:serine/threonine-protein kinase
VRGAATQRRPLALLALLAAAGDAGVPREQVLLYLWPDSDPPRGRSSLNQLLYALRRDLGVADLVLGNATLRLNRHVVGSDVADFRAAVAAARPADAAALYAGPFLEGFSIPELAELERWVADARARLESEYRTAAAALGTTDAQGAPAPDADRETPAVIAAAPTDEPQRTNRGRRSVALVALGLAVAGAAFWFASLPGAVGTEPAETPIAVLPFALHGGDPDGLGAAVPALLAASLDGAGAFRAIDPDLIARAVSASASPPDAAAAARAVGARLVVRGEVARTGNRLRLVARLGPPDSLAGLPAASAEGPADSLFALIDRLAADLLASRAASPRERLERVAATTTASLPALKAYMEGERELRADRYAASSGAFRRAVELDSTFALAYYRLSRAAEWAGRDTLALWAIERAARFAGRLADDDRLLVEAAAAWRAGDAAAAETRLRAVVDDHPDHLDAWFDLGEVLFHGNPLRGRSGTEAAEPFRRVLALDPTDAEALVHLARIEWLRGRPDAADSLVRRALALVGEEAIELRAFRAFALGDRDGHKQTTRALLASGGGVAAPSVLRVAVYLDDLEGTEEFGAALTRDGQPARLQALGARILARTALARGRWRLAFAHLGAARPADPISTLELRGLGAALPFVEYPADTLLAIATELETWDPRQETAHSLAHMSTHPQIRLHLLGLVYAALGDSARALAQADELDRTALDTAIARTFSASVRAHVAWRAGRHADALRLIEGSGWPAIAARFETEALDRYLRADALARTGRGTEALGWLASLGERAAYELVYAAPAAAWQAALLGDARGGEAARHGNRARELWVDADQEAALPGPAASPSR